MVHGGQYALLKHDISLPGYKSIHLDDGWVLSVHEKLPVYMNLKRNAILLGYAWSILANGTPPSEAVINCESPISLLDQEENWCGRYLLILDGTAYPDPCCLLNVFYSAEGISSDLSLLDGTFQNPLHSWKPRDPMRWYPAPDTPIHGIHRLLPSQVFHIRENRISFRSPFASKAPVFSSEESLIRNFSDLFASSLRNMASIFKNKQIFIALTGGYDSRTLFALACKAGISFECFTLEHDKMPLGDIQLPPEICSRENINFSYIPRDHSRYSPQREKEYMTHNAYLQREQDLTFYTFGQYNELQKRVGGDLVLLRSSVWEISQEYYRYAVSNPVQKNALYDYLELPAGAPEINAFNHYFDWCETNPLPITDTDRYFWDQRCPGWLSENERSFDLYENIISLQPANSRLLITLLFQFPREDRIHKQHQRKIAEFCCPSLQGIPYGANSDFTQSKLILAADKFRKLNRRIARIGISRTLRLYREIGRRK